jgi:hypothetical protein
MDESEIAKGFPSLFGDARKQKGDINRTFQVLERPGRPAPMKPRPSAKRVCSETDEANGQEPEGEP